MGDLAPPPHLSPSSIATFQQCPLKFRYAKIDGLKEDPTDATLMGNFVHDVLEEFYLLSAEDRTLEAAKGLARTLWDTKWRDETAQWVPEAALRQLRWNAWWCIENLWGLEDPAGVEPSGIEQEINTDIEGVTIKGFIDRWSRDDQGMITVTDYKTGKTPRPQYQGDKYQQLMIYAIALQLLGHGEVKDVELLFLKGGDRLRRDVTAADVDKTVATIVGVHGKIVEGCESNSPDEIFYPNPSILCNWCSFKPFCPAWTK
jgi:putative RecB family exonuclease